MIYLIYIILFIDLYLKTRQRPIWLATRKLDQSIFFSTEGHIYNMVKYTFWVACCFTLNYVIGSGFLTLPWAFNASGLVLASLVLTIITAVSLVTSWKLLEVICRANALADVGIGIGIDTDMETGVGAGTDMISIGSSMGNSKRGSYGSVREEGDEGDEGEDDLDQEHDNKNDAESRGIVHDRDGKGKLTTATATQKSQLSPLPHPLGTRKFEIAELCDIFLGPIARRAYICTISIYFYGTLWAYSTVFAHAWSNILCFPGLSTNESYYVYLVWWAIMECIWVNYELDEQIIIQVLLAVGRVMMVIIMICTVLVCDFTENNSFDLPNDAPGVILSSPNHSHSHSYSYSHSHSHRSLEAEVKANTHPLTTIGGSFNLWDSSNLYIIMPIAFYANVMHHSVPTLINPIEDKTQAGQIFIVAIIIAYFAYLIMALIVSTYFGKYANASSNLDWIHYQGAFPDESQLIGTKPLPYYATLITLFIVIFPSIDVASAYPLNAITLGNNLMTSYYGTSTAAMQTAKKNLKGERTFFRLLAALPPIIAAVFIQDLGPITAYTGLTGIIIACIVPSVLSYYSEKTLQQNNIPTQTVYTISIPRLCYPFEDICHGNITSDVCINVAIFVMGFMSICYIFHALLTKGVPTVLT